VIERVELLIPGPAEALAALLDVPFDPDEPLPLLWHWLYLLDRPKQSDLGTDGHPVRGGIAAAPPPGRRRMWAGGSVRVHGDLRIGAAATRRSYLASSEEKQGRSGSLLFVSIAHEIVQDGALVIDERQDLVYREPAPLVETPSAGPTDGGWEIPVSPSLLFRFSALTYNGHRIHYDRDYARDVEGYPGLVTHGPLQAVAMAEAARVRDVRTAAGLGFEYRLVAPLLEHQGLVAHASADGTRTRITDTSGRETATGRLQR
jgi:3-methylfumaryl-CoA hydratase